MRHLAYSLLAETVSSHIFASKVYMSVSLLYFSFASTLKILVLLMTMHLQINYSLYQLM